MMVRNDEQKTRQHDVENDGNCIAAQERIPHNHPHRVHPTHDPQRRRKPFVRTYEIAAAAGELDAHRDEHGEDENLRGEERRVRQQPRLPLVHRRQKRSEAGEDEQLTRNTQRKQHKKNPEDCGHGEIIAGRHRTDLYNPLVQ